MFLWNSQQSEWRLSLTLLSVLGTLFLLLGCHALVYLVTLCSVDIPGRPVLSFLEENRTGDDLGGGEVCGGSGKSGGKRKCDWECNV